MVNPEQVHVEPENTARPIIFVPQTRLGKFGCGIALLIWFTILLIPCGMFWLASGNMITISRSSDFPQASSYPIFQVQLIMEIRNRGLQITRTDIYPHTDLEVCVTTMVDYLLWERTGSDDLAVQFCDCYRRETVDEVWDLVSTTPQSCP